MDIPQLHDMLCAINLAAQVSLLQYKHYDSVGESCSSDTAFTNAEL